jgi:hypothetical protein
MSQIELTRINRDVNGNPRFTCHILNFVSDIELRQPNYLALAWKRAKSIGGKKYGRKGRNADMVVFQSFNTHQTKSDIWNSLNIN